ncbi:MAG: tRNA-binding protein [bacterium]|nr:tRNA-binding protein [bacterium]
MQIIYQDFEKLEILVGRIIQVEDFPQANKPSYKLYIDFGSDIGIKKSSSQLTINYTKDDLLNELILAVVNLPPKLIGDFTSEVLVLGINDKKGNVVLVMPTQDTPLGGKLY